jgi:uncharacterized protein (TIGR03118 family)
MRLFAFLVSGMILPAAFVCGGNIGFNQTNLVSDLPGVAANTDPNLVNPWGISFGPTSPFWIANNGSGTSTLYNGAGTPQPVSPQPLIVTVPSAGAGPGSPTGTVFNGSMTNFGGNPFLFASEDGIISAWKPTDGTAATVQVNNSGSGAVYKGMTLAGNDIFVTNFNSGAVEEYDSSFTPVSTAGKFLDPSLPAGFAPFNIQDINGDLYVTYALQDAAKHDDVAGPGNGFVAVYDASGNLLSTLISQGALNSPWGLAVAPAGFGSFGGDLLVGNFGDGMINVFNISTGAFIATLDDANGMPLINQGLWSLAFGNGAGGAGTGTLFITAGIPGPNGQVEDHGLFASIDAVPEPASFLLIGIGLGVVGLIRSKHARQ